MQSEQSKRSATSQSVAQHLGHLDALRGIAILAVIVVHTAIITQQIGNSLMISVTGQRGVQLFYMISAFTLCLSLDGVRREANPLFNYFIRRFFRIAPLFYFMIIATHVFEHLTPGLIWLLPLRRREVALGFLFLNGVSPRAINNVVVAGWSIAVETTFYLTLPWLHRYFNTVRRALLLFVFSAPVLWWVSRRLSLRTADPINQTYFSFLWFPVEFPVFVLGILTYCIWTRYIKGKVDASGRQKDLSLLLIVSSFMLYCACLPFTDNQLYFSSFLFLPLILGLSLYPWPLFVNGFTRFIGKISYSLYLIHALVIYYVIYMLSRIDKYPGHLVSRYIYRHALGMPIGFLIMLGISVPICMLSWKFIEQPGIGLGRRIIAHREGRHSRIAEQPLVPALHEIESPKSTRDAQF
jgi:peptidoglycan/LPS O-acetylase OafA/YrhL